ncbi:MAG: MjaI family restriction endonuclease, partial [Candidatus Cloacimonadaceae bacterium]|nr:MjaI family restriction endonuclease [Candidatus Cloacimonadaceae bacterium]MDP3114137.1 MjaI family restriction endonuclease [Candidatus Cloacimonadaceae bacterium]
MNEWHKEKVGENYRYHRETQINYGTNRWGLNKSSSIGKTSELIRNCAPKAYQEWIDYYFQDAVQNKQNGIKVTKEFLEELGKTLYIKLTEVVQKELELITLDECIDYVYNLVINRTFEGYHTEIQTIYGILEKELSCDIKPALDEWDRTFGVDFYIEASSGYQAVFSKLLCGNCMHKERCPAKYRKRLDAYVYNMPDKDVAKRI